MGLSRTVSEFHPSPWWYAYPNEFVGAVGTLMNNTGLEELMNSAFGGVLKMLSGKKYPQNLRPLRMVVEEL